MAADRGAAARAIRHDLVALVEQVLVPDLPQQPPDRLDVLVGERVVGVVQVDPEADALGEALPLLEVGGDALPAQLVELGDAVGLDLPFAVDAEAPLHLELHRQAVGVPAGLARHAVAAHRLVAREEVLEDARDDVVRARPAVGRGRPLVEDEDGGVVTALEALLEDAVFLPELEDAGVERREVDARRDVLEPGLTVAEGCPSGAALVRWPAATMEGCPFGAPLVRWPAATIHVARFLLVRDGQSILPDERGGPRRRRPAGCC